MGQPRAASPATQTAPGTIDRLILTGSPGSGVQSIDQYNVPKGHVYESSAYAGDMVEGLGTDGSYGKNPQKLEELPTSAETLATLWLLRPRELTLSQWG